MLRKNERHVRLLIRYFVSGLMGATVTISMLYLLEGPFGIFYLYAAAVSYVPGSLVSFFSNKYWTYKDNNHWSIPRQFIFYATVSGFNFIFNILGMYVFVEKFGVGIIVSQIAIIIMLGVMGYMANTSYTFKRTT